MAIEQSGLENPTLKKFKVFDELFERTLLKKGEGVPIIDYDLPYPKEDFLDFIVEKKNALLHGSSNIELEILEPRQANDRIKVSGNKKAVYGVTDPVLPIFYAIQDRDKIRLHGVGGYVESGVTSNSQSGEKEYKFKMPKAMLDIHPWKGGIVYVFDRNLFHSEVDDTGEPSGEWISDIPVKPIAKLRVTPTDFRFLDSIEEGD